MPESVCASGRSPTSSRQRARARSSSARASAIARSSTFATAPYIVSHLSSAFPDRLELTLPGRWVGKPVARVEDPRLLAGQGRYLADLALPGALHAAFVRSPLPHARVLSFDIAAALAADRVRFAGEAVAVVLAGSRYEAEDGAELVAVEYAPLAHAVDVEAASATGAALLFPDLGSNVVYRSTRTIGDVEGAFRAAAHVSRSVLRHNRYAAAPLETRGCAAAYEPAAGELTFWSSTQSPHLLRRRLALATGIAEARIRVLTPDVGGGFGQKIPIHPEEVAVALAARRLGRPVVWVEDRRENLIAAPHAKEQVISAELALAADGEFLALRARIVG